MPIYCPIEREAILKRLQKKLYSVPLIGKKTVIMTIQYIFINLKHNAIQINYQLYLVYFINLFIFAP